ncbi:hypothetical protein HZC53_02975 [Candidatus Uhrbacteria bacterium]|nr:hypothetical protein [Candidatus Uhrbacteria bacterium]
MKYRFILALIGAAVGGLFVLQPVLANDGPTFAQFGAVKPAVESVISMDKELVEFIVPENPNQSIPAKATFWFSNPTDKDVEVQSIFPLTFVGPGAYGMPNTYAENVSAKVDGLTVKGEVKYEEFPYRSALEPGELEPKKAEGYVFPFKVPAKKTTVVVVEFDAPLSQVEYLTFNYYIGSGAGWAGPIKEAKFVVHYPYRLKAGWIIADSWYDGAGGYKAEGWGKDTVQEKDYILTLANIEPNDANSVINFDILPPSNAKQLMAAEKGMASFKTPEQWWNLARVYRSFEFENGQFDAYRPRFAVDGYWMAIDEYLAAKELDPFKPVDYRQATELAELYSDHWASNATQEDLQFYDLDRFDKLFTFLETRTTEWWGVDLHRLEGLLALGRQWRDGRAVYQPGYVPPAKPAEENIEGYKAQLQAFSEQVDQLKNQRQALVQKLDILESAGKARAASSTRSIDPISAFLLVLGGVLAGFASVALIKYVFAKR